ncbi:MAG: hypothetical protein AB7J30_20705 [Hyphomicrobium sp.]|uniref:hypothetical protein n=1 Tax=Hyphomicrobium sp. TaxID=82 RepID=UPI003D0E7AE3
MTEPLKPRIGLLAEVPVELARLYLEDGDAFRLIDATDYARLSAALERERSEGAALREKIDLATTGRRLQAELEEARRQDAAIAALTAELAEAERVTASVDGQNRAVMDT